MVILTAKRRTVAVAISSLFIGIAVTRYRYRGWGVDDGFWTLLAQTILQLFSLYVLLLPFVRDQEPRIRGFWFGLSIGASVVLSVVSLIVYVFSWQASAIVSFFATLSSSMAALLLVDGIDKASEKGSTTGDHGGAQGEV